MRKRSLTLEINWPDFEPQVEVIGPLWSAISKSQFQVTRKGDIITVKLTKRSPGFWGKLLREDDLRASGGGGRTRKYSSGNKGKNKEDLMRKSLQRDMRRNERLRKSRGVKASKSKSKSRSSREKELASKDRAPRYPTEPVAEKEADEDPEIDYYPKPRQSKKEPLEADFEIGRSESRKSNEFRGAKNRTPRDYKTLNLFSSRNFLDQKTQKIRRKNSSVERRSRESGSVEGQNQNRRLRGSRRGLVIRDFDKVEHIFTNSKSQSKGSKKKKSKSRYSGALKFDPEKKIQKMMIKHSVNQSRGTDDGLALAGSKVSSRDTAGLRSASKESYPLERGRRMYLASLRTKPAKMRQSQKNGYYKAGKGYRRDYGEQFASHGVDGTEDVYDSQDSPDYYLGSIGGPRKRRYKVVGRNSSPTGQSQEEEDYPKKGRVKHSGGYYSKKGKPRGRKNQNQDRILKTTDGQAYNYNLPEDRRLNNISSDDPGEEFEFEKNKLKGNRIFLTEENLRKSQFTQGPPLNQPEEKIPNGDKPSDLDPVFWEKPSANLYNETNPETEHDESSSRPAKPPNNLGGRILSQYLKHKMELIQSPKGNKESILGGKRFQRRALIPQNQSSTAVRSFSTPLTFSLNIINNSTKNSPSGSKNKKKIEMKIVNEEQVREKGLDARRFAVHQADHPNPVNPLLGVAGRSESLKPRLFGNQALRGKAMASRKQLLNNNILAKYNNILKKNKEIAKRRKSLSQYSVKFNKTKALESSNLGRNQNLEQRGTLFLIGGQGVGGGFSQRGGSSKPRSVVNAYRSRSPLIQRFQNLNLRFPGKKRKEEKEVDFVTSKHEPNALQRESEPLKPQNGSNEFENSLSKENLEESVQEEKSLSEHSKEGKQPAQDDVVDMELTETSKFKNLEDRSATQPDLFNLETITPINASEADQRASAAGEDTFVANMNKLLEQGNQLISKAGTIKSSEDPQSTKQKPLQHPPIKEPSPKHIQKGFNTPKTKISAKRVSYGRLTQTEKNPRSDNFRINRVGSFVKSEILKEKIVYYREHTIENRIILQRRIIADLINTLNKEHTMRYELEKRIRDLLNEKQERVGFLVSL